MKLFQSIGIFCLLAVSLLITGCGGAGGGGKSSNGTATTISIISGASSACTTAYSPDSVTILVGETVTWKNNDTMAHTVTSTSDSGLACTAGGGSITSSPLDSGLIAANETFSHTFDIAGTYYYVCTVSGHLMRGTVIVE
ncbi:MAG TPA: plastocyanin/azurin family copper-binding protein [Syntrophales bacterium]|nr:plastocyanin/azurin family copper-binding protein [Syntrophales bacterium]